MQLADMRPDIESEIEFSLLKEDTSFDWKTIRNKYSDVDLKRALNWIANEKEKYNEFNYPSIYSEYDIEVVLPSMLNADQKQVFKMIEHHY